ncbi:hypothetical protein Tco_0830108, partial [Tanacetum coccineum]
MAAGCSMGCSAEGQLI